MMEKRYERELEGIVNNLQPFDQKTLTTLAHLRARYTAESANKRESDLFVASAVLFVWMLILAISDEKLKQLLHADATPGLILFSTALFLLWQSMSAMKGKKSRTHLHALISREEKRITHIITTPVEHSVSRPMGRKQPQILPTVKESKNN